MNINTQEELESLLSKNDWLLGHKHRHTPCFAWLTVVVRNIVAQDVFIRGNLNIDFNGMDFAVHKCVAWDACVEYAG